MGRPYPLLIMPMRRVKRRVRTGRKFVRTGYQKRIKVFIPPKRYYQETDMTLHTVRTLHTVTAGFNPASVVAKE